MRVSGRTRKRPSTTFKNSKRSTALITTAMQATGSRRSDGRSRPTILRPALMASGYGGNQSTRVLVLLDRKSTRLNSSHQIISYAVFCLKKKTKNKNTYQLKDQHKHSIQQCIT